MEGYLRVGSNELLKNHVGMYFYSINFKIEVGLMFASMIRLRCCLILNVLLVIFNIKILFDIFCFNKASSKFRRWLTVIVVDFLVFLLLPTLGLDNAMLLFFVQVKSRWLLERNFAPRHVALVWVFLFMDVKVVLQKNLLSEFSFADGASMGLLLEMEWLYVSL